MGKLAVMGICLALCGCQRTPGEVFEKVLVDFGVREQPAGYVSDSDRVFERLAEVGRAEMKRMNYANRQGETRFQESAGFDGQYYREVKVYENFFPIDIQSTSKAGTQDRGYVGYIEYAYRMYQSVRTNKRTDAAAEQADIPTDVTGRDKYRYNFTSSSQWDGEPGHPTKR